MTDNLLIIMSDEHQARALGCAGHDYVLTPNLDRLAGRATLFSNAYTPSPICVPARASFATGLYPHQTRLWDNAMPYTGTIPGWGHALQDAGIPVESIGKLHYRSQDDPTGFDHEHIPMMVADGVGMVWASIRDEDERVTARKRMLGERIGPGESPYTEYDRSVTATTCQWLRDRSGNSSNDRPWCLYVGLVAPHFPLVVPKEFYDLYQGRPVPEPKLHPASGYRRHPWVEKQNAFMNSEDRFHDQAERQRAIVSYYALCSWLDHNIGLILQTLDQTGQSGKTTFVYTSDHGDNVGARGLWGKSNLYEESVAVPLIVSRPTQKSSVCHTPVSLLDLSRTIANHFDTDISGANTTRSLYDIANEPTDAERVVFSEYHAAGAVSGAFMVRKGRFKLNTYVGFDPELFDLEVDPEETENRATDPTYAPMLLELQRELHAICDLDKVNREAFADQAALIERHGGREAALTLGAPGATPPPVLESSS